MAVRGFDPVCTNNEAREYFGKTGLTYNDIKEGDILVLVMLLQEELKKSNKAGETSADMTLSSKIDMKKKSNGSIICCYMYMNSHYFTRREAISFNKDGFIGFAGWADQGNTNPLLRAFLKWCDYLANGAAIRAENKVNEPLTKDDLLKMNGEPVWYQLRDGRVGYGLITIEEYEKIVYVVGIGITFVAYVYGEANVKIGAVLYRKKPTVSKYKSKEKGAGQDADKSEG